MKSFFTKLSVLLFGVAFAVAGCQDYDEDIRKVNDQLNANTAELTSITDALDKAIKDLEAKMVADYATKKALADLSTELKAEIDADVAAAKTALEAAYKAADAVLKSGYEAADAALKAELQKAIADAKAEANTAVQNLQKAIDDAKDQMQQGLKDANDYTAMVEQYVVGEFKKVNKAIDDLNKTVADLDEAYKAADAGLQKNIDAAIAKAAADLLAAKTELTAAYEAAIKTAVDKLQVAIDKNTALAEGIKTQLLDHMAEYKETIAQLENQVTTNEGEITMLKVRALALETQVEDLQALHATDMENMQNVLNNLEVAIQQETAQRQAAIEELDAKHTLANEEILAYVGELEHQIRLNAAAIKNINDVNAAQDKAIEDFGKQLETLRKELKEYYALKTDVTTTKEELNKLVAKVAQLEKDVLAKINDINSRVNQNTEDLKKAIAAIADLKVDVDKLLSRIQSVVYVPTHADGKARVDYVSIGRQVKEYYDVNTTQISYRVYPADAAAELAAAVNEGNTELTLSYVAKTVTRASNQDLVEVVSAVAKDGVMTLRVKTNFGPNFFMGKKSYSGALVVTKNEADQIFSTEYVNFIPGDEYAYTLALQYTQPKNGKLKYTGDVEKYDIKYTSSDTINVLDNVIPVFEQLGGMMTLTEKEFEFAYGIVPNYGVEFIQNPKETKVFNVVNDATADVLTKVNLAEIGVLQNVGETLEITHAYKAGGDVLEAYALIEVIGELVNYDVKNTLVAEWAYELDAKSDAGEESTSRTFKVAIDSINVDNTLANTSLKDVLANVPTSIKVNGTAVESGITLTADDKEMTVTYTGFEWDETYNVVAEYKLNYATVYVKFTVETIDRNREPLVITIGESNVEFVKDLKIAPFGDNNKFSLAPVIDSLVANGNLDDAKWAEDIFVDHATVVNNYSKYDAAKPATPLTSGEAWTSVDLRFNFARMNFSYAYETTYLPEIYQSMIFTGTFTTWYGQVVTVKHNFNLTLPVYDFKHQTYYVMQDAAEAYYSQVTGKYTPEYPTPALTKFEVNNIELDKAFYVADKEGNKVENLAALGLVTDFDIEGVSGVDYGAGIVMSDDNIITYNDKTDKVDVLGKLYIVNTNGTKVELPTSFATTYANYYVAKYDPIGSLVATNRVQVIDNAKVYEIPVLSCFSLKDRRNFEEAYELIDATTGTWVAGNNENGFGTGYNPADVYGLAPDFSNVVIPAGYEEIISFENGILTFDNTNHMGIVEDINIDIIFVIKYTWGYREAKVTITFPKNIK